MEEIWHRWEIGDDLTSKYYVVSITDNINGFRMLLSDANDESNKVEVSFEDSVHAYRSTDEESIFHFSFLAVDSLVDVIAAYEPKIFKLN